MFFSFYLTTFILQDSRNFKKTLLQLERLYYILIDVEDCEKKLAVLPTGIPLRSQVESDGKEGIRNLGLQLGTIHILRNHYVEVGQTSPEMSKKFQHHKNGLKWSKIHKSVHNLKKYPEMSKSSQKQSQKCP